MLTFKCLENYWSFWIDVWTLGWYLHTTEFTKYWIFYMSIFKRVTCEGWLFRCSIMRKGVRKPGANRIRTRELFDTRRDVSQYANNEPRDDTRTTCNLQGFFANEWNVVLQQFLHSSKFLIIFRYFRLAIN